jgi:MFS family permease
MIPAIPGANIFSALRGSSTFLPLRNHFFAMLWTASLVSNFGSLIQSVGAQWLMTSIAPSADMVALVQTAITLPILLFSLPSGAVADIWERRTILLISQILMLTASSILAVIAYLGDVSPILLLSFTFALGVGAALWGPSWQASVGDLVPRSEVPAAVALNSLGFNLARAAGPAIGGIIVAAAGPEAAFILNAFSYIALIVVLLRWHPKRAPRHLPPEEMIPAMGAGIRYASLSPAIRAVLLRCLAFGIIGSAIWALLPLVARDIVGGGPIIFGTLLGGMGVGAIIGAFVATPIRQTLGTERMVLAGTVVFGLAVAAISFVSNQAAVIALLVAAGTAWVLTLSTFNVTVQMASPRWVMGRTIAVYQMMIFGGMAVGSWLWGLIAHGAGVATAIGAAGFIILTTLMLTFRLRLPEPENVDLTPSGAWPDLEVTLEIEPTSGPIFITVEYRVAPENVPAFRAIMRDMRRARRRDGARYWALIQDVGEPEIWTERYEAATWIDHLRQNARATVADKDIDARALALHMGPLPPKIRHFIEWPVIGAPDRRQSDMARHAIGDH